MLAESIMHGVIKLEAQWRSEGPGVVIGEGVVKRGVTSSSTMG